MRVVDLCMPSACLKYPLFVKTDSTNCRNIGGTIMRMADWLGYAGMEQLKKINRFYQIESEDTHSKKDLIVRILQNWNQKNFMTNMLSELSENEYRFFQILTLDTALSYTMEELLAKSKSVMGTEGNPRKLIVKALQRGWLFPGYTVQTQYLYHVPSDLREKAVQAFRKPFLEYGRVKPPAKYREEEDLLVRDLQKFLQFIEQEEVKLSNRGAIYKNQQKQLFELFYVSDKTIINKGPRFGFGRRYYAYPDRFSLLYDYAFYQGYFFEDPEGYLCLNEQKTGNISYTQEESEKLYRFWIRLYRRPIPHLPLILRWIGLLANPDWFPVSQLWKTVAPWFSPYYYETEENLFQKVLKMLLHLGAIQFGEERGEAFVRLTSSGRRWIIGISAFQIKKMEDEFIHSR